MEYPSFFEGDRLMIETDELGDRIVDQTKDAAIELPRKIEYGWVDDFETLEDKKVEIKSIEDWIYVMESEDFYGHTSPRDCFETMIGIFEGAICESSFLSPNASYSQRAYFFMTPDLNFEARAWIRSVFGPEETETSADIIEGFFNLSDQIIETFNP